MMKKNTLLFLTFSIAAATVIGFFSFSANAHYTLREKEVKPKQDFEGALNYWNMLRANPSTGKVELADVLAARQQVNNMNTSTNKTNSSLGLLWKEIGPDNVGGRTRAILIDKQDATGKTLYIGACSGGIWKSVNGGTSWFRFTGFPSNTADANMITTSICQAANNDIYVGTGEYTNGPNGTKESEFIGGGVYKMPVGTGTFTLLQSTKPIAGAGNSSEFAICQTIAASPTNSNRIYVGTSVGLRVTDDGGLTWYNPVYNSSTHYDSAGNVDFAGGTTPNFNGTTAAKKSGFVSDVSVSKDGTVIVSIGSKAYISPSGDDNTFECVSTFIESTANLSIVKGKGKLPTTDVSLMEFAFAPSDPNYIYAIAGANGGSGFPPAIPASQGGGLKNVYQSKDKGVTWKVVAPGGSTAFAPLGNQGWYALTLAVNSTNPGRIFFGGLDLYAWKEGGGAYQISNWVGFPGYPYYAHADQHAILWDPTNSDICYFGNDGGIFKTITANTTNPLFINANNGYAVTQFYSVAFSKKGDVMAGAQDNGTQYIDYSILGSGLQSAGTYSSTEVYGGDGFSCDISNISPKGMFATIYNGALGRSSNGGGSFSGMYNATAEADAASSPFNTIIRLWEKFNNTSSRDSIKYTVPTGGISAGTTLTLQSKTSFFPFNYTFSNSYNAGSIVKVQDPVQARLVVPLGSAIWLCSNPLDFSVSGNWTQIAKTGSTAATSIDIYGNKISPIANDAINGDVIGLSFSVDGNYLYLATSSGSFYVIKNLNTIKRNSQVFYTPGSTFYNDDDKTQTIGDPKCALVCRRLGTFPATATGIASDPKDPNKIVVTLGNYGVASHVYRCTNATTAPSKSNTTNFVDITNNLPEMPVYDVIIDFTNSNKIVLGTEYGIYGSDDDGATWTEENNGMERVPVHMLRQQTLPWDKVENSGEMYIGTHARGIFKSSTLLGIKDIPTLAKQNTSQGIVYPNPVTDVANVTFSLIKTSDVEVKIYDIQGRVVKSFNLENKPAGEQIFSFDKNGMLSGTYFVSISADETKQVTKFVVIN